MIVQPFLVLLILSVATICGVTGASYSNVFVESEVAPRGYYTYGAPYQSITNPRLSQINSLPSVPGYVAPCVSPCVYPAQTVATVAPVNPSANVLTYNAPSVPIVVAPTKQDATGYEYSYVVYDENTGDHKAQRELSDGSVVRGEYSFLQPDGFVRQVQYVADDISGFNAVVKQYLPTAVEGHRKVEEQENKESSPPCHEIKNESLKEESEDNSGEISIKKLMKIHGKLQNKHPNEDSAEKSKGHRGTSKESGEEENSKEKHRKVSKEESGEDSEAASNENHSKKPKHSKKTSGEESEEKSNEKPRIKPKHSKKGSGEESEEKSKETHKNKSKQVSNKESEEESEENSQEETPQKKSKETSGESKEKYHKKAQKDSKESGEEYEEETSSEESKEELKQKSRKKSSKGSDESREKNKKNSKKGSYERSNEESGEESEVGHGKNQEAYGLLKPNQEALVPYNDVIRCIEAAMRRNYGVPAAMRQEPSPLTYIVLNKPC